MVNRKGAAMAAKRRGIDLMKKVSDKRAADLRQLAEDKERHFKRPGKRASM
jgi:hypothetical protein